MAEIEWDKVGDRTFEAGVDRGVLYPSGKPGVPWNGLVSAGIAPSGGTTTALYIDGVNHYNHIAREQFGGSIEAYTYPEEFLECDGTTTDVNGVYYSQQPRKSFHLSYRTLVGNDLDGTNHGYKIHLIYNALATPTNRTYGSLAKDLDASTFSWTIVTTPERIPPRAPTAKLTIDSRVAPPAMLAALEDILYGRTGSSPRMPSMAEVTTIFDSWPALQVNFDDVTGFNRLTFLGLADLKGDTESGIYQRTPTTRLIPHTIDGYYKKA